MCVIAGRMDGCLDEWMDGWMDLPTSYHFGFPLFTQLALDDEAPGSPATLCRIRVMENG